MLTKRFKVLIAIPSVILISLIVAVFVDEEAGYLNFYQNPIYIFALIQIIGLAVVAQQHYIKDKKKTDF